MAQNPNTRVALWLTAFVAFMVASSFAAVPFYSWFCRVTGYAVTTSRATAPLADEVVDRTVTVHFDANIAPGMPWQFRPKQKAIEVKLGETGLAFFEAYNPTTHAIAGQAGYNVVPFSVGEDFDKIACFCFNEQTLQPGETLDVPVVFYVDPAVRDDSNTAHLSEMTLSYTYFASKNGQPVKATVAKSSSPGTKGDF